MPVKLDRNLLQRARVRVIVGLFHEELQCKVCNTRWRVNEPLPPDYWRCPNGCNENRNIEPRS